jgi:hypothetical protein
MYVPEIKFIVTTRNVAAYIKVPLSLTWPDISTRRLRLWILQMASQLPIIYRDLVRLAIAKMAEGYGVEVLIPSTAQVNRDAWDSHPELCCYGELRDAFIDALKSFEETQGYRVEELISNDPEREALIQCKEYVCGVMEDMGSDATYDRLGAVLSCASFLIHACEHIIQYDGAMMNSGYVEALVSSLKIHTPEAWQDICWDMISM